MDCGICSAYLAFTNNAPRRRVAISHCSGCRAREGNRAYLKGHCVRLASGEIEYGFECSEYSHVTAIGTWTLGMGQPTK